MKFLNIIILLFVISTSSQSKLKHDTDSKQKKSYELIEYFGVLVESFSSTSIDKNKYNNNNNNIKVGNRFKYKYEHISPNNEIKYFKVDEDLNEWEFVNEENIDSTTVKFIEITVANGNPMEKYSPGYNQTTLFYKNGNKRTFGMSGAIENEGNVWIHPPREDYFKILQLNPFPYIKSPYIIGNKWNWNLKIGSNWADPRWKVWKGNISIKLLIEKKLQQNLEKLNA